MNPRQYSHFILCKCSAYGYYPHGMLVQCRVLAHIPSKPMVEVSLRKDRIEGDLDDDETPEEGQKVQAYVVSVTKKGCFIRTSRLLEGRVLLKELCDGFMPDPATSFPQGRLVVGKVKRVNESIKKGKKKTTIDLDMRESVLMDDDDKLKFEDVNVGEKYKGTVTRIAEFGVFVRIENSDVSGLCHTSECSDKYVKKLDRLYDPGDFVKILVIKKNDTEKKIGFSMKASHFANDEDSDDDVEDMDDSEDSIQDPTDEEDVDEELSSDDVDYVQKLAAKMEATVDEDSDDDSNKSTEDSSGGEDEGTSHAQAMDTDVGFDWGDGMNKATEGDKDDSDSSEEESSDEDDDVQKTSHKSRKKQAQRRREEQEIARRERALADGTADENPETAADFERLLATDPNSSELWIKYMAFRLSLADVDAAREIANRAFQRIEFREEREKLNVWCALLALELKFGSEESFQDCIDRACKENNPKHVYMRVCETLESSAKGTGSGYDRAEEMYQKMCKKFKSKKSSWLAHIEFLLRHGRHEDAYDRSKRAIQSLPEYKHLPVMLKYAQLSFEYGSPERARTLFDGLLRKYPKRLDLFFVYSDKEIKHGDVKIARQLFQRVVNPDDDTLSLKLSDKQMKSLFKKWFAFEETHGTEESSDHVKEEARAYVQRLK